MKQYIKDNPVVAHVDAPSRRAEQKTRQEVDAPSWRAKGKTRQDAAATKRLLTDLISLVRLALHESEALVPFEDTVRERYKNWLDRQVAIGRAFTDEQRTWLDLITEHIATSLSIEPDDFDYAPFSQQGGLGKARQVFGKELSKLLEELNEVLAA